MRRIIFYVFICLFFLLGIAGFYFASTGNKEIPFYGWFLFAGLIILPALLLIKPSGKQVRKVQERMPKLAFTDEALIIQEPLFDQEKIIDWSTIDTILFANYSHDEKQFILYLKKPAVIKHYENRWWLNRLFKTSTVDNCLKIRLYETWGNFHLLIEEAQKILPLKSELCSLKDQRKGALVDRISTGNKVSKTIEEHWKPDMEQPLWTMIYDIKKRTVTDIYNRDHGI